MKRLLGISAVILCIIAVVLNQRRKEGFQLKTFSVVLRAKLQDLTSTSNLKGLALSAFTPYKAEYDVKQITDSKGQIIWRKGDQQSSDVSLNFYKLDFGMEFQADGFSGRLAGNTSGLEYIGTEIPMDLVQYAIVKGSLEDVTSSVNLRTLGTAPAGRFRVDYSPVRVIDASGKLVWNAGTPQSGDKKVAYYKIEYNAPFSATAFRANIRKGAGVEFVGFEFPKDLTIPTTTKSPTGKQPEIPSVLQPVGTRYVPPPEQTPATYQDPRKQDLGPRDYSKFVATQGVTVTDRIKIQTLYKNALSPQIITSIEKGLGMKPDSKGKSVQIRVTEILDRNEKQLWPKAEASYKDTSQPDVFIIGFDTRIDVNATIRPYIEKYIPSIKFYSPATPRGSAPAGSGGILGGIQSRFSRFFMEGFQNADENPSSSVSQGIRYRNAKPSSQAVSVQA